jgi:hypothetical protein
VRVIENPTYAEQIVREAHDHLNQEPREPGYHVSDLIYCLRKSYYRRTQQDDSGGYRSKTAPMFLLGQAHHVLLQRGAPETKVKLVLAGFEVHGTVDRMDCDTIMSPDYAPVRETAVPVELKSTRKSAAKPLEDSAIYLDQVATYCLATGSRHGRIVGWFMMGSYGNDRTPVVKAWDVWFDHDEMIAWESLLATRVCQLDLALHTHTPPPITNTGYIGECAYCEFNMSNGGPCPAMTKHAARQPMFQVEELPEWILDGSES